MEFWLGCYKLKTGEDQFVCHSILCTRQPFLKGSACLLDS